MDGNCPITIIIPFFRNERLVQPLFESLEICEDELRRFSSTVLAINDSPQYEPLRIALVAAVDRLQTRVPCTLLENKENVGFVRACNTGMEMAAANSDILLLNSDTALFSGALTEMRAVAYSDPAIGFVNPRSNNATLASLPHSGFEAAVPEVAKRAYDRVRKHLAQLQYVPTAVGFCLFIKRLIIREFGTFDEAYGRGYNEENDLVMRANRAGFRAALANRAFVFHHGEASFSATIETRSVHEERNSVLLERRYPEYRPSVNAYLSGAQYQSEVLAEALAGDAEGKIDMLFDISGAEWLSLASAPVHLALMDIARIHVTPGGEQATVPRSFAVGFRLAPPSGWPACAEMATSAAINIYYMADTAVLDCLVTQSRELEACYRFIFQYADAVVYPSASTAQQFRRRFEIRSDLVEHVWDLGRAVVQESDRTPGDALVVIGSSMPDNRVDGVAKALQSSFPGKRVVVPDSREFQALGAGVAIVASVHGSPVIPIVTLLARRIPVFVRECCLHVGIESPNVRRYECVDDLIMQLETSWPAWIDDRASSADAHARFGSQLTECVDAALKAASIPKITLPRLQRARELDAEGSCRVALADTEVRLRDLQSSLSWSLTAPLRAAAVPFARFLRRRKLT